jgi:serine/threonine-protein kinase
LRTAAAIAVVSAGWAAFLWQQLRVARSGGDPFCALGGGACATLWDGAFASQVQAWTGLPVAGWGVVWSGAAALAAGFSAARLQRGRPIEPWWSSVVVLAASGVAVAVALTGVSAAAGEFCSNCAITYAGIAAYAGAVFLASGDLALPRGAAWTRGVGTAGLAIGALFLALLYPGLATPRAGSQLGGQAFVRSDDSAADPIAELSRMIAALPKRDRQALSNARARYAAAQPIKPRPVRARVGPESAAVHITTFTDSACSHCALFHDALVPLLRAVPAGSVAVEQRVFPLDRSCNELVGGSGRPEVCLAARVRVCLERDPRALELAGWLHHEAAPLSTKSIYREAERLTTRASLEACVAAESTDAKLRDDIEMAREAGLTGTPFLLVNGKPAATFMPFLYALVLAGGDIDHEVFAGLPAPIAARSGHEGHAH